MTNMPRIVSMREPPGNMRAFLGETAQGLRALYGSAAADEYLASAPGILEASLAMPNVKAFAAVNGLGEAQALLMAVMKPPIAHIVYLHVLAAHRGQGVEGDLLRHALAHLRDEPLEGIISEYLATQPQDLEATYRDFGFTPESRALMLAPLDAPPLGKESPPLTEPIASQDWEEAAAILAEAYRGHPGRHLHLEVRDEDQAHAFLQTVARGGYGTFDPAFARLYRSNPDAIPEGMIIGSRAAPGIGFVLHVAVHPAAQGKGIGTHLVRELADAFRDAGYDRIGLGVTDGNPARRLYERLGFEPVRNLTAWYWWRKE